MSRKQRRHQKSSEALEAANVEATAPDQPDPHDSAESISVRLGWRSCMTSKGPSRAGNRFIRPGAIIELPAHEAKNLVNLGYATYA